MGAGGEGEGGWTDELVYLVSVGVECVCVKGSLVLVLVKDRRSANHAAGTHG